jgi:hypothetical protein
MFCVVFDVAHIWIYVSIKPEASRFIVVLERFYQCLLYVCSGADSRNTYRPLDSCELWDEVPWLQERHMVYGYVTRIGANTFDVGNMISQRDEYRVHKNQPLDPILTEMIPVHTASHFS